MLDEKEFEALYDEILEEFGCRDDEPPVRNFANGYGRDLSLTQEAPRPQTAPLSPESGRRSNGGLILTLCLEIAAILAVIGFWVISFMG